MCNLEYSCKPPGRSLPVHRFIHKLDSQVSSSLFCEFSYSNFQDTIPQSQVVKFGASSFSQTQIRALCLSQQVLKTLICWYKTKMVSIVLLDSVCVFDFHTYKCFELNSQCGCVWQQVFTGFPTLVTQWCIFRYTYKRRKSSFYDTRRYWSQLITLCLSN